LGFDLPSLLYVLDVTATEAEADAEVEAEHFDPERETDSYTDKRKERRLTKEVEKNEHTLLEFSFELVFESTLEPPLRLGDGLFPLWIHASTSTSTSILTSNSTSKALYHLVDTDPDFKLRLVVLAMSISIPPLKPKKRYQHLQPLP